MLASWLQPAFLDEAFVYYVTKGGWQAMIDVLRYDTHTPVYNLLMYPLVRITDDMLWLRMPSVLCGLAAIILSFHLSRRFCSERAALAISAFMALSYNVWLTDSQLRSYGLLAFLCILQWLGCSDIYRRGEPFPELPWPRLRWPLYAFAALFCASVHVLGTLMQGVLALFACWLPAKAKRCLLGCSAAAIVPSAVWFAVCRSHSALQFVRADNHEYALQFIFTPLFLLNFKSPNDIVGYLGNYLPKEAIIPWILPAYLIGNAIFWIILIYCWYKLIKRWKWEGWLLAGVFNLPLLAVLLSCLLGLQPYTPRYAITLILPFLLALAQIDSKPIKESAFQLTLGWTLLLCAAFPFCHPIWNQYWQSVTDYIDAHARSEDVILVYNPYAAYSFALAYDPQGSYFEFSHDSSGYHVALRRSPDSRKLTCFPLSEALLDESFLSSMKNRRVFLVLCQRFLGDNSLLLLGKRFQIADSYHFASLTSWADAEVCILEYKQ